MPESDARSMDLHIRIYRYMVRSVYLMSPTAVLASLAPTPRGGSDVNNGKARKRLLPLSDAEQHVLEILEAFQREDVSRVAVGHHRVEFPARLCVIGQADAESEHV